jgi:hypothetical protein
VALSLSQMEREPVAVSVRFRDWVRFSTKSSRTGRANPAPSAASRPSRPGLSSRAISKAAQASSGTQARNREYRIQ